MKSATVVSCPQRKLQQKVALPPNPLRRVFYCPDGLGVSWLPGVFYFLEHAMDWDRFANFQSYEFACSHTGKNGMKPGFMEKLQALRTEYGKPMTVTSGYRHPTHPIEARKASPGAHASGRAADIAVSGGDAMKIIELALKHGFTGIGVNQKGAGRFIHLDDLKHESDRPRPWVWSY